MKIKKKGLLLILSSPSGGGKTTLKNEILKINKDFKYSISYTTRTKRSGEVDGVDYNFISKDFFLDMASSNMFLEYAEVHSNFYGTSKEILNDIDKGHNVILDIDIQGAAAVKEKYNDAVMVFIVPPMWSILVSRLRKRETDNEDVINQRLINAKKEISKYKNYDYLLINDNIYDTVSLLNKIVNIEKIKIKRLEVDWNDFFSN